MLHHIVLMKFNPGVSDEDVDRMQTMLDALPDKIIEIQTYEFGRDIVRSERSYDFALVSLFANPESLERYRQDPDHLKVLDHIKVICDNVITADFLGSDAGSLKEETPDMGLPDF